MAEEMCCGGTTVRETCQYHGALAQAVEAVRQAKESVLPPTWRDVLDRAERLREDARAAVKRSECMIRYTYLGKPEDVAAFMRGEIPEGSVARHTVVAPRGGGNATNAPACSTTRDRAFPPTIVVSGVTFYRVDERTYRSK